MLRQALALLIVVALSGAGYLLLTSDGRQLLDRASINYTRWQKKRSSELLGINASTLYRKLIAYGIEKPGGARDGGLEDGSADSDEQAA